MGGRNIAGKCKSNSSLERDFPLLFVRGLLRRFSARDCVRRSAKRTEFVGLQDPQRRNIFCESFFTMATGSSLQRSVHVEVRPFSRGIQRVKI